MINPVTNLHETHKRTLWVLILMTLLSSCCQERFLRSYDSIGMRSEKVILEAFGDTVPFQFNVTIPKGTLCNNIQLCIIPCLVSDSLVTVADTVYIGGIEADKANHKVNIHKDAVIPVNGYFLNFKQFQNSYFTIRWQAEMDGKVAPMYDRLLGYGISQVHHMAQGVYPLPENFDPILVRQKLEQMPPKTASDHYLLAIMCARKYDEDAVKTHLQQALLLDPSIKLRMNADIEFIGYRETEWFKLLTAE